MEKNIKFCECGSIEFVTEPNQYDVYQIIDNNLELIETYSTGDFRLFCRDCSKEIDL
jgi:hypothetical protein